MDLIQRFAGNYAEATQLVFGVASIAISVVSVVIALIANKRAIENQRDMRIHSSPKPFIELAHVYLGSPSVKFVSRREITEGVKVSTGSSDDLCPTVRLKNLGPGTAVNVIVSGIVNSDTGEKSIRFDGPSIIPVFSSETASLHLSDYTYTGDRTKVTLPDVFEVSISYQSDSGYTRETVWQHTQDKNGKVLYNLLKSS